MTTAITDQEHSPPDSSGVPDPHRAQIADESRRVLAGHCADTAELRRLGAMLGLFATDPVTGATVEADPWTDEPEPVPGF